MNTKDVAEELFLVPPDKAERWEVNAGIAQIMFGFEWWFNGTSRCLCPPSHRSFWLKHQNARLAVESDPVNSDHSGVPDFMGDSWAMLFLLIGMQKWGFACTIELPCDEQEEGKVSFTSDTHSDEEPICDAEDLPQCLARCAYRLLFAEETEN